MTPFFRKVMLSGVIVSAFFIRLFERIERRFRSKAHMAQRATGRFEALKRKEREIERLDRLRNPSDYQGR